MLRVLPGDYLAAFGVRLMAVESFTDPAAHAGTTYAACGFTAAGPTAGYGRSRGRDHYVRHGRPKICWLRELAPGGLAALAAGFDSPVLTGRAPPDFNRLDLGREGGLLGCLEQVTDHRKPKGRRHGLAAILAVVVVARLSGANSVYAAGQFAATMPQEALRRCGIRYNARLDRYVPPSPKTIKRAVRHVDAKAADEQMCAWLRAEAAAGRLNWRHIAIDGKTVRGAVQPGGTRPHLLAAYDVTAGAVLGQERRQRENQRDHLLRPPPERHPRRPRRYPANDSSDGDNHRHSDGGGGGGGEEEEEGREGQELIIVTADAMHTQTGHVEAMNAAGIG